MPRLVEIDSLSLKCQVCLKLVQCFGEEDFKISPMYFRYFAFTCISPGNKRVSFKTNLNFPDPECFMPNLVD